MQALTGFVGELFRCACDGDIASPEKVYTYLIADFTRKVEEKTGGTFAVIGAGEAGDDRWWSHAVEIRELSVAEHNTYGC